jgi:hypothetical protein
MSQLLSKDEWTLIFLYLHPKYNSILRKVCRLFNKVTTANYFLLRQMKIHRKFVTGDLKNKYFNEMNPYAWGLLVDPIKRQSSDKYFQSAAYEEIFRKKLNEVIFELSSHQSNSCKSNSRERIHFKRENIVPKIVDFSFPLITNDWKQEFNLVLKEFRIKFCKNVELLEDDYELPSPKKECDPNIEKDKSDFVSETKKIPRFHEIKSDKKFPNISEAEHLNIIKNGAQNSKIDFLNVEQFPKLNEKDHVTLMEKRIKQRKCYIKDVRNFNLNCQDDQWDCKNYDVLGINYSAPSQEFTCSTDIFSLNRNIKLTTISKTISKTKNK